MRLFRKRAYVSLPQVQQKGKSTLPCVPDGKWVQCKQCMKTIYFEDIGEYKICPHCSYHFRLKVQERLDLLMDEYEEVFSELLPKREITFPKYEEQLKRLKELTQLDEAVLSVKGKIKDQSCMVCVMDSHFLMGSMGQVVGERISLAIELATRERLPIIIFAASGGARMQEGIFSLMQMAKISSLLAVHASERLPYISVLTDPTTGGVTASFAMLGDIILAEPKALIGFAGRRVIEQTIKQKLPETFQTAELVLQQGFIDEIVDRKHMKDILHKLLKMHSKTI